MTYRPANPNGQATSANSAPVVIASDQSAIPVTTIVPGTGATNLGKAEDAVAASGDVGVMALAVRSDTAAATAANGDYIPLIVDASGRLHVAALVAGSATIGSVASITTSIVPGTAATNLGKAEDAVAASGDVGVAVWSVRRDTLNTTLPTTANGDYQQFSTDPEGVTWSRGLGVYNATPITATNGNKFDIQLDVNANLKTVNGAVEVSTLFQALYNDVDISVKATSGYFQSVIVTNINAAVRYFQIHNKASAPTGGDAALFSVPIPAGTAAQPGYIILDQSYFGVGGLTCSTGIAVGISTAAATFTAATTTDHTVSGFYV